MSRLCRCSLGLEIFPGPPPPPLTVSGRAAVVALCASRPDNTHSHRILEYSHFPFSWIVGSDALGTGGRLPSYEGPGDSQPERRKNSDAALSGLVKSVAA